MLLQFKKIHQPFLPPLIPSVFLLSICYWIYLSLTTQMVIVFDSVNYQALGRLIQSHGWPPFFSTGPNREPVYPLLIAIAMNFENMLGIHFTKIMAFFGVIILFLTQIFSYKILRILNVRQWVCALILAYLGISPAFNNSAFSLFSEIATYPFVLGIILTSFLTWEAIKNNQKYKALFYSMLIGIALTLASLVKGVFEGIAPVYFIILFSTIYLKNHADFRKNLLIFILSIITSLSFFYIPITGYKWLNFHYNKNFVLTTRASFMIYGNTSRRMNPLTLKKFAEALAYVPGEGFCNGIFGIQECSYWNFQQSDILGSSKEAELSQQKPPLERINSNLIKASAQSALHNPFQYSILAILEALKMFFWESTKVGFVSYPHWLGRIYDIKIFNNGLRLLMSLLSLIALVSLWRTVLANRSSPLGFIIGLLSFLYIFFFSFVCILTRYALPIAPLYLISIGLWINQKLPPAKN